jgi:hypothetical protein
MNERQELLLEGIADALVRLARAYESLLDNNQSLLDIQRRQLELSELHSRQSTEIYEAQIDALREYKDGKR